MKPIKKRSGDYQIAWIAALPIERSSATEMLDEEHLEPVDFIRNITDSNSYDWGRIHDHDIVIASLPAASYGKVNAAHTVTTMLASLPHIKFGFLIGIGAGIPSPENDIRLGDVVVGQPDKSHGGVIQYDLGKLLADGSWEQKGFLKPPPDILLHALANLRAKYESGRIRLTEFLTKAFERNKYWASRYSYPSGKQDRLFASRKSINGDPSEAMEQELVRVVRESTDPQVHFGLIASGDTVVKNSITRDSIPNKIKEVCICLEMEAAGVVNKFPCTVIRGISDYADSHKSDDWQRYASATASAFAKELLLYVPRSRVLHTEDALCMMLLDAEIQKLKIEVAEKQAGQAAGHSSKLINALYTCPYAERKDRNIEALPGTCQWFMQHPRFLTWLNVDSRLLWVSADPGCGKSVLAKHLVDTVLNGYKDTITCYFFFKDDFLDQKSSSNAMCAVLRQLLIQRPDIIPTAALKKFDQDGEHFKDSFRDLWDIFLQTCSSITDSNIICVFDALDECQTSDRSQFIQNISFWFKHQHRSNLKILVTSRPYGDIKDNFYDLLVACPTIHLSGESEAEAGQISKEIGIVIKHRIRILSEKRSLSAKEESYLITKFESFQNRTYLWAHLTLDIVERARGLTKGYLKQILATLPGSVSEAYEKILNRSLDFEKTRLLLHILMAAERPLNLTEMSLVLSIDAHQTHDDLEDAFEPADRFRESIRDLCGLFVVIMDSHVYFLHQTAREFLIQKIYQPSRLLDPPCMKTSETVTVKSWANSLPPSISHGIIAERCLWYLSLEEVEMFDQNFLEYCNQYWPRHFAHTDSFDVQAPQTELALVVFESWSQDYWRLSETAQRLHKLSAIVETWKSQGPPAIIFPAWFGHASVVELMLQRSSSSKNKLREISSALWYATLENHFEIVQMLLSAGALAEVNHYGEEWDPDGRLLRHPQHDSSESYLKTPLGIAIENGNMHLVVLLLSSGANIGTRNWSPENIGYLPLHIATGLRDFGSKRAIKSALDQQKIEMIKLLIHYGADPTLRTLDRQGAPVKRMTALQTFLKHRNGKCSSITQARTVLKLLLVPGMDIDERCDGTGHTLLNSAAFTECLPCVKVLLEMGASSSRADTSGDTLLHHAARHYQSVDSWISIALNPNIEVDSRNARGETALMVAAQHGNLESALLLIKSGANVDACDLNQRTPLMYASQDPSRHRSHSEEPNSIKFELTKLFARCGANINKQDVEGTAGIHETAKEGTREQLEIMLRLGADPDIQDNHGKSPMMMAAPFRGSSQKIKVLLEYSADPSLLDIDGETALSRLEKNLQALEVHGQRHLFPNIEELEEDMRDSIRILKAATTV